MRTYLLVTVLSNVASALIITALLTFAYYNHYRCNVYPYERPIPATHYCALTR